MGRKLKFELPPLKIGNETIGQRIARFRKEIGCSQRELAKKIGITNYLVSDYETGRLHLNDEMVARFAIALEVSADEILGLKNIKHSDIRPTLRIMKRLNRIKELPLAQQKALLRTIDMAIKTNGK
ncbi:hypothetical protein ES703_106957 [subsurface metagenome]